MADHDPLCQWANTPTHRDRASCPRCALIARVRADEREQVGRVWAKREDLLLGDIEVARADERERVLAEANATVARLGEQAVMDLTALTRERDAARAEVAALKADYIADYEDHVTWAASIRREVLADLRAKVEALPFRTWVPPHAMGCPGRPGKRGICTCGDSLLASDWMLRAAVLALLDKEDSDD